MILITPHGDNWGMKHLKTFLNEECGCELADDAPEADVKAAAQKAIADGKLTLDKYTELLGGGQKSKAEEMEDRIVDRVTSSLKGMIPKPEGKPEEPKEPKVPTEKDIESVLDSDQFKSLVEKAVEARVPAGTDVAPLTQMKSYDILKMGASAPDDDPVNVRVKSVVERFDNTKTALTYQQRCLKGFKDIYGRPVEYMGKPVNKSTSLSKALALAWFKLDLRDAFPNLVRGDFINQQDRDLLMWAAHNEKFWVNPDETEDVDARKLSDSECANLSKRILGQKALIDDSTSGGENAIPEFFDQEVIILRILGGEIAPLVNMIDVPRGTAAQGFTMGDVSFAAANTEGSATSLFSTASFVAAHDTTFFRAAGFIEVGRNFLADAVPQMLQAVLDSYSRKAAEWIDEQVAAGDGTTEPQGITVASGTTDITPATPTTGAIVLADVVEMLFGVAKAYRDAFPSRQAAFGMTDTTYERIRSIATGVTGDTRLVFGDDLESYQLFGHPVVIEENGLSNSDAFFCQLGGYRLYRRQGVRFFNEMGGDTLTRQHTVLLGADMRYGGQLDRGNFAAVVDSFPS